MIPMRPYAITSDAGPPAAKEDPEPTNRPVPNVCQFFASRVDIIDDQYQ
jgi:hypothetical protein